MRFSIWKVQNLTRLGDLQSNREGVDPYCTHISAWHEHPELRGSFLPLEEIPPRCVLQGPLRGRCSGPQLSC